MFGMRKWSTPVLRPAAPFIVGSAVVFYLVAKAQDAMINSTFFFEKKKKSVIIIIKQFSSFFFLNNR